MGGVPSGRRLSGSVAVGVVSALLSVTSLVVVGDARLTASAADTLASARLALVEVVEAIVPPFTLTGPSTEATEPVVSEVAEVAEVALFTVSAEGFHVASGTSTAGEGREVTFTVEVEPAAGADLLDVLATVEAALYDTERSWARDVRLVRVDDPAAARVRVLVASPATVDRICGAVGLSTNGRYSCWSGRLAALNSWRWENGAADFGDDLALYRRYLVNHEVGHGLGHGHVSCPGAGQLAPIMVQQSISTRGCVANGWPYPKP
jgi:hypothetical protein